MVLKRNCSFLSVVIGRNGRDAVVIPRLGVIILAEIKGQAI